MLIIGILIGFVTGWMLCCRTERRARERRAMFRQVAGRVTRSIPND